MVDLEPGTPEYWLRTLDKALSARNPATAKFNAYYQGDHPLLFASEKFRKAFGELFRPLADNWIPLVVDAVEERLDIEGFRLADQAQTDTDAWDVWQRNQLDADSQLAHIDALIAGGSYALVWPDPKDRSLAQVTVEQAEEVIVATVPGDPRTRAAALKLWADPEAKLIYATVYLPDGLYKFEVRYNPNAGTSGRDAARTRWERREVDGEPWPLPNPLKVVPVVTLPNRPRIGKPGRSEIVDVIPKQDACNKLLTDMLVASEFGAFRQRWATGLDVPEDPTTHQQIEPFKSAIDRLWISKRETTTFGEFQQSDLRIIVGAIEMVVQHIASQSRTPPHYFYLSGNFPSGESIKSAEVGLVAKTRRKMRFLGEAWEEVMRLALQIENKPGADDFKMETVWRDPQYRTEGEHVDALVKLQSIGVPDEALWQQAGFTPTEIELFKQMRAETPPSRITPIIVGRETITDPLGGAAPPTNQPSNAALGDNAMGNGKGGM